MTKQGALCFSSNHLSDNQAGHHSQFAKQGETLDSTAHFFVQHSWRQLVQKQPCRKGSSRWSVMLQYFTYHPLNQSQGRAAGLERWEILSKTVPHIHHMLQETISQSWRHEPPQLKKPEKPSAEELGIMEENHWFRLFTHTQKEKHLFWSP